MFRKWWSYLEQFFWQFAWILHDISFDIIQILIEGDLLEVSSSPNGITKFHVERSNFAHIKPEIENDKDEIELKLFIKTIVMISYLWDL